MNSIPSNDTASIAPSESGERDVSRRGELLDELLLATSRTFGLAIPMLPAPLRAQVTVAYLLFRLADTIEDGEFATAADKLAKFDAFADLVRANNNDTLSAHDELESVKAHFGGLKIDNEDYQELVDHLGEVIAAANEFPPHTRNVILSSLAKSIAGMRAFVAHGDDAGNVRLTSLEQVPEYCYAVAGIVGEMLTELFVASSDELKPVAGELRQRAKAFGEGLQLVNILKDSTDDQVAGRQFIPDKVPRQQLFDLARNDLTRAQEYIDFLTDAAAAHELVAFCDLPVRLAWATLERIEADGPGSKITRAQVTQIVADVMANGRPAANNGNTSTRNQNE